jgi:hypothetical protein
MSDYPDLINAERAANLIAEVEDPRSRNTIHLLIDSVKQFFAEQPSQLRSPFDLAFFVEVLKDRIEYVRGMTTGTIQPIEWPELDSPSTYPVLDPATDANASGIREIQAHNYVVASNDRKLRNTLWCFINGAFVRQRSKGRLLTGEPMVVIIPDHPFDYLFMVMAADYALRPGKPARLDLEGETVAPHSGA